MGEQRRKEFESWYNDKVNTGYVYKIKDELIEYCMNDVEVLRQGINAFQKEFSLTSGIDPFQRCITIASVCMTVFNTHFLEDKTIPILDNQTMKKDTHSKYSIRWMLYHELKEGITINHARNGKEEKVGHFLVDGFCSDTNTIYEYLGYFWHGCVKCYSRSTKNPKTGTTMGELYDKTIARLQKLENLDRNIVYIWEHDWKKIVKEDKEARDIIREIEIDQPLLPGDAFYGSRTEAVRPQYLDEVDGGKARYLDYMSLYPWVNKYGTYPIGMPEIIIGKKANQKPLEECFGLVKATVLPPGKLYFPVLPYRYEGKLYFPLCRQCVETSLQMKCQHTENERCLSGTWVTTELQEAKKQGYKIVQVYEIWH